MDPKDMVRRHRSRILLIGIVPLVVVIFLILLFGWLRYIATQNQPAPDKQINYSQPINELSLEELVQLPPSALQINGANQLVVNGELTANQAFVLTPGQEPFNPSAGQLYFDSEDSRLRYYDGQQFVALPFETDGQTICFVGEDCGFLTEADLPDGLTVPVPVNVESLTNNAVLLGNGGGAIQTTSAPTAGQILVGSSGGAPVFRSVSGDVTLSPSGVINVNTGAISSAELASTGITAGSYGDGSNYPIFTVDGDGRIISVSNQSLGAGGSVSSVNSLAGALTIAGTANRITVSDNGSDTITISTPQDIAVSSSPTFAGLTLSANLSVNGSTTLGNALADLITINGTIQGGSPFVFEGATADGFETTISIADPTAFNTITFPDDSGTVCLTSGNCIGSGGGGAPNSAQYLTLAVNPDLTAERVLVAGNGLSSADGGANGNLTLAVNVDGSTLEINADTLRVATGGITTTQILDGTIVTGDIGANVVALGSQTTGNYVATISNGSGISGSSSSEGGAPTIALGNLTANWQQTGAFDIVLDNASSELQIRGSGGAFYATLDVGALTGNETFNLAAGTAGDICTTAGNCVGSGGGSAPQDAQYLTLALSGNLSAERVLTPGTSISITDGGANGNYDINTIQDIRTTASPTFDALTVTTIDTGNGALEVNTIAGFLGDQDLETTDNVTFNGLSLTTDLAVTEGGTGASTLTDHGVLVGSGTGAITALAVGSTGQCLLGSTGADPTWGACPGDGVGLSNLNGETGGTQNFADDTNVTISSSLNTHTLGWTGQLAISRGGTGAATLDNLITLGTHTTGNYVATISNGSGISGSSSSEGGAPTIALGNLTANWQQTGAFDIVLDNASSELQIRGSGGAFYATLDVGALTGNETFNLAAGTAGDICTTAGNCVGSGGGSAPQDAQYLTLALSGNLSAERVLTPGTSISITDGGANGNYDINTIQDIRTTASPTFASPTFSGTLAVQGASITVGGAAQLGQLILNDGSSHTGTIALANFDGNYTLTIPNPGGADSICLQALANCNEWTDGGTFLFPADLSGAEDIVIGGTSTAAADIWLQATGAAVFNEQGADADFRVEGVGQANALFVQGSDGFVGIGTGTPGSNLEVAAASASATIGINSSGGSGKLFTLLSSTGGALIIRDSTAGANRFQIASTGVVTINPQGANADFIVQSDTHNDAFQIEGALGTPRFGALDCTGNANGGAITADASGALSCTNDDSGGTMQDGYNNSSSPATILTADGKNILFSLADSATTDSDFIVDILGTGNIFEVQDAGTPIFTIVDGGNITFSGNILPGAASTYNIGSTSVEINSLYVADNNGINFGLDQDVLVAYDEAGQDRLEITGANANLFIEDRLSLGVDERTIASTGDGNPATLTLNPNSSYVEITCGDPDTCDITMDEAVPIREGNIVVIVNAGGGASVVDFADTTGVSELNGVFPAGPSDTIVMIYIGDRWAELSRSDN